jgi:Lon protease-like protein
MSRLGLFPLGLVLVPTERVPLHIFEPRYKELIGECIETGSEFGVLLEKPSGETHEVGTRASVAEVLQSLPDGRMDIVVQGGDRFRLIELQHDRAFLSGTVEEVRDEEDPPEAADVERALEAFARLQETVGSRKAPPDQESPLLDFEIVARVDFGVSQKQELIELASPRLRFARLAELLEHALEALSLEREVRQRAEGNGKVPSSPRLGS